MDKEQKIKNAAMYWHTCEKEGFPKSQKEVFQEWLNQDIRHKNAFNELKDISINSANDRLIKKDTRKIKSYLTYLLFFFIACIILSIMIIINLVK